MKKLLYLSLVSVFGVFASCSGSGEPVDEVLTDTITDTIDTTLVDSSLFMDDSGYVNSELETNNIIEAKYGVQWDFCDCVVKNDSINKVLEKAGDDADYDAILERMEVIDMHCKTMLTAPNTTPDEREAHERKVRKCLKNAK
jgi:hypothetical protein